ncbi:hypothetical protein G6F43_006942 [Rhizopus delemar]|nr:hypothetical protein G6F43_006942 [Rhizopus delemar]
MGAKQSKSHRSTRQNSLRRKSVNTTSANHSANTSSNTTTSVTIDGRQYHNESSAYILPKDEIEQDRLNSQHFALKAVFDGKNILDSIHSSLPKNATVLDLGCGTGCWVLEMAVEYPEFKFIGLDMADMFPTTIRPENVKFQLHNILHGLPFHDNTFDFVNMRIMLTAFLIDEWPFVIKEIYRVLKPGGFVELMESKFPEDDQVSIVKTVNQQFYDILKENNKDPCISTKLGTMLQQQNFDLIETQERSLQYKQPLSSLAREMLENWKLAVLALKPLLANKLVDDPEEYESLIDDYVEGLLEEGWEPRMLAYAAQKPLSQEPSTAKE